MTERGANLPGPVGPASAGKVIGDIEILRGLAICMVLVAHFPFNLMWGGSRIENGLFSTWNGASGVDLFFAVSGFVIARSLLPQLARAREAGGTGRLLAAFWLRRAFRLLPAAWIWLVIPLFLTSRFGILNAFGVFHDNLRLSLAAMLNVANLELAHHEMTTGSARVYWSLSLEEQFYFVLPLMVLLSRRYFPWVIGSILACAFFMPLTRLANFTRPGALAAGVLIAIASTRPWYGQIAPGVLQRSSAARALVTSAIIAALGCLIVVPSSVNLGVVACLSGFLVFAASYDRFSIWPERRGATVLRWLGSRSYALYLTHMTAYSAVRQALIAIYGLAPPVEIWLLSLAIVVALSLAVLTAEVTHRLVEIPFRRYGRMLSSALLRPAQTPAPEAAPA